MAQIKLFLIDVESPHKIQITQISPRAIINDLNDFLTAFLLLSAFALEYRDIHNNHPSPLETQKAIHPNESKNRSIRSYSADSAPVSKVSEAIDSHSVYGPGSHK